MSAPAYSTAVAPRTQRGPGGLQYSSVDYQGVEFTITDMRRMVKDSLLREQAAPLRKLCEEIIAHVNPKDYLSEVAAIYYYVLKNIRYTRDHVHVEFMNHPLVLLQPEPWDRKAGRRGRQDDCESISSVLAAMCMCIGNPCEFCTISTSHNSGYHHVYVVCQLPSHGRVVLDPIPGPHAASMLRSIARHEFWPVEPVRMQGQSGWGVAGPSSDISLSGGMNSARAERIRSAADRHAICAAPHGLGWEVPSAPSATSTGPCPFGQMHVIPA